MVRPFTLSLLLVTLLMGVIAGFAISGMNTSALDTKNDAPQISDQIELKDALYADQEFLSEMINYNENQIKISKDVLAHTSRKEIRVLASETIEAKTKANDEMRGWLKEWE